MNAIAKTEQTALAAMPEAELLKVLQASLYPGAAPESIKLVLGYCKAAGLDPMQKPVHIVPMWDSKSGTMRDVVMPGVNLYRTQAARSGECAGVTEPEFGEAVTKGIGGITITYPEWCRVTVSRRLPTGEIVAYTAREYWMENYAVKGGKEKSVAPNAMWMKRPFGQIAKCAEAQALRKAFPEIASQPTAEEMEGKAMRADEPPQFEWEDPAPLMAGIALLQTDAEAAAFWNENKAKLQRQAGDYKAFKDAVIAHRKKLAEPAPVAYAEVEEKLRTAPDLEALELAADLIKHVADPLQREELTGKYQTLRADMVTA